ncbi:LTA synthase family protein [bacterium]|nr:LTA synthase family protein [bacterium]
MQKSFVSKVVAHPILLALYSVLALFSTNLGEMIFQTTLRSFGFASLVALIVLGAFYLVCRNWQKAGIAATWTLLLFFTYGHVYNLLKGSVPLLARHRYLLLLWGLVFILGLLLIIYKINQPKVITKIFNIVTLALVGFSLFSIGRYYVTKNQTSQTYEIQPGQLALTLPENQPDIYYILLDGYTRADVLDEKFGFDNSSFINSLEQRGFYVPTCNRSNYTSTQLNLATLLNMDYLDGLVGEIEDKSEMENVPLEDLGKHNKVMSALQQVGYETVAFETSYYWSHFTDADYYFEPVQKSGLSASLSSFEEMYLDTTLVAVLLDWNQFKMSQIAVMPRQIHYNRINYVLSTLKELPNFEGPQFTFAHMVIPHPPYIFDENGLIADLDQYNDSWQAGEKGREGYLNNIRFINQEIIAVIDEIQDKSSTPPLIIIQSDHGSDFTDRTMNFAAYYFPGEGSAALYNTITPVNTFRLVFDTYFGATLPLLPDQSFASVGGYYEFQPVDDPYPQCQNDD